MKRLWLGALSAVLTACGATATPPSAPSSAPPSVAPSAAPEGPVLPGARLAPGGTMSVAAAPGAKRRLLLANTSDAPAVVGLAVDPVDAPTDSPTEEPTPPETPPFGFGFGTAPERVPPWGKAGLLAVSEPQIGATVHFWINDGSTELSGDRDRTGVLELLTDHACFLVDREDQKAVKKEDLERLAQAFEQKIRPPLTRVFGAEDVPGIDGEPRLFIVLSSWVGSAPDRQGMMGYFWPRDPVPKGGPPGDARRHANEKEVIFLNTAVLSEPELTGFGTLAHEYQHLLMFCAKTRIDGVPRTEDTWLDEGFSMLAMDLAGYGLAGGDRYVAQEIADFQHDPGSYSLTDWKNNPNGRSYGLSYLFCRYLVDRFGLSIVRQVEATTKTGVAGLDAALRERGTTFANTFVDWALANRPKDEASSSMRAYVWFDPFGRYGGYQLEGAKPDTLTAPGSARVRPWGVRYLELEGLAGAPRTLTFSGASAPLQVIEAERRVK